MPAGESTIFLQDLLQKAQRVSQESRAWRRKAEQLQAQNRSLELKLEALEAEKRQMQSRLDAQRLRPIIGDKENKAEMKKQLDQLIREIDACLKLLSD
jgi:chromosomal replication initiation ATPase DnaA